MSADVEAVEASETKTKTEASETETEVDEAVQRVMHSYFVRVNFFEL